MFCERQWALIHLEGLWHENRLTAEGRNMHDRSHEEGTESRGDVRVARGLRLRSLHLGLSGKADMVEFHRIPENSLPGNAAGKSETGISLKGIRGIWRPVPVEYKRGRPKENHCDVIQLCAQAICLEEMLGVTITEGSLYYGRPHRRYEVAIDKGLREETEVLSQKMHMLAEARITLSARYEKRCDSCSLVSECMPRILGSKHAVQKYLLRAIEETKRTEEGGDIEAPS
jgi:CRISPR-associated exonuclease Cas4